MAGDEGGKGSGPIIIGVILLLGAAGGILWWVNHRDATPTPPPVASVAIDSGVGAATTIDLPAIDLPVDSGPDVAPETGTTKAPAGGPYNGCPAVCSGGITDAIKQAAAARAGTAKQCYKTALEGNESLAGQIDISLKVGLNGETCAASVVSDTTGSSKLQQCVRSKMIATYPQPKGGCVELKVPVVFKPKT
jgi:hypothetical protein